MKSFRIFLFIGMVFSMSHLCIGQAGAITFDAITQGALGSDYADKVNEISRYDYSSAMSRGSVNLWLSLDKNIRNVNKDSSLDQNAKMETLKEKIDDTYKALERYKNIDSQESIQEEKVALLE